MGILSDGPVLPPRFGNPNTSQRPRPIPSGTQRGGELVEEIADSGGLDRVDCDAIDAGGSAVSTNLAPRPLQDVAAGDLVQERVETTIPVLLGTAVQHALEGTNTVHTQGATDRPSRSLGTHQSPSHPLRASMKRGPFPHRRLCCPQRLKQYYDPLRLPLVCLAVSRVRRLSTRTLPPHRSDGDETGLPRSQDDHPHVQRPIRRRVPRRPLPDPRRLPWPSPPRERLGFHPRHTTGLDDACSGFTHVADRAIAPPRFAPGSTTHRHHYQGPGHLPGPDSHRQAALNLSLGLCHDELLLFTTPKQSGRTTRKQHPSGAVAQRGVPLCTCHRSTARSRPIAISCW